MVISLGLGFSLVLILNFCYNCRELVEEINQLPVNVLFLLSPQSFVP